jgi:hypothetical protein
MLMYEQHGMSDPFRSALLRVSRNAVPFGTKDGVEMSVGTCSVVHLEACRDWPPDKYPLEEI